MNQENIKYGNSDVLLREVQKVQIEILNEVQEICRESNIEFHLFAGSLLGAVRHNGFIPWDDDIDICMLREDYEKFLKICKTRLNNSYFLQTKETDPNFYMQFAKIRKNNTLFLEELLSDIDMHHGVYIDIFPLDNVEPYKMMGKVHQKLLYLFGRIQLLRVKKLCLNSNNPVVKIGRLTGHYLVKILPVSLLNYLHENLFKLFNKHETKYVSHLTNGTPYKKYKKYLIERTELHQSLLIQFENKPFPIPINYEVILQNIYGNYMELPPVSMQKPHHGIQKIELN